MAVTGVIEQWQGRGATTDESGVRTLKRSWLAGTDSDLTGGPAVIDAVIAQDATAGLYAPHPLWPWAVCRKLAAEPHNGPRTWRVTAEYSSAPFRAQGDGSGSAGNPSSPNVSQSNQTPANERAPTITVARKEVTKPLEYDAVTGQRVVNDGVGDPFDPPIEVFRSHHVITWKFFRLPSALNWGTRSEFQDSLNNAPYAILGRTYAAKTLRCTDYSFDGQWETGETGMQFFFAFTVQVEFDPDGWQPKILNRGRRKRVPATGEETEDRIVVIVDGSGQPVADPVPLTDAGLPVEPGMSVHYVEPAGYVPKSWAGLLA